MMHSSEYPDEHSIAQKLNFATPQKEKSFEWKVGGADSLSRNLFDSHKKAVNGEQVRLVMPLIIVDTPDKRKSREIVDKI